MPDDMAMVRPYPRIIPVHLPHGITVRSQQLHVSPLGVVWVDDTPIPGARALLEDEHIVAVEMHRMAVVSWIGDHHADAGIRAPVLDVRVRSESVLPFSSKEKHRAVVVGAVGFRV